MTVLWLAIACESNISGLLDLHVFPVCVCWWTWRQVLKRCQLTDWQDVMSFCFIYVEGDRFSPSGLEVDDWLSNQWKRCYLCNITSANWASPCINMTISLPGYKQPIAFQRKRTLVRLLQGHSVLWNKHSKSWQSTHPWLSSYCKWNTNLKWHVVAVCFSPHYLRPWVAAEAMVSLLLEDMKSSDCNLKVYRLQKLQQHSSNTGTAALQLHLQYCITTHAAFTDEPVIINKQNQNMWCYSMKYSYKYFTLL